MKKRKTTKRRGKREKGRGKKEKGKGGGTKLDFLMGIKHREHLLLGGIKAKCGMTNTIKKRGKDFCISKN